MSSNNLSCYRSSSPVPKFLHAVHKNSHAGTVFLGKEYIKVEGDVLFFTSMMNRLNAAGINYRKRFNLDIKICSYVKNAEVM